jgi:hypothetical protein
MMLTALVVGTGNERVWPRAFTDASSETISNFEKYINVHTHTHTHTHTHIYLSFKILDKTTALTSHS